MGENRVLDQALYSVTGIAKELEIKNKQLQQELDKYKTKEKELRKYLTYETEYGLWKIRTNEIDEIKATIEEDILDILERR
jgi:hypothetical protein